MSFELGRASARAARLWGGKQEQGGAGAAGGGGGGRRRGRGAVRGELRGARGVRAACERGRAVTRSMRDGEWGRAQEGASRRRKARDLGRARPGSGARKARMRAGGRALAG